MWETFNPYSTVSLSCHGSGTIFYFSGRDRLRNDRRIYTLVRTILTRDLGRAALKAAFFIMPG